MMITKKISGDVNRNTLAWWLNFGIDRSLTIEQKKKDWKITKSVRLGSIENEVYKNGACLIASTNEIYDWIKENDPKDQRLKYRLPTCKFDDDKIIWAINFNFHANEWQLEPMRHIGKNIK